MATNLVELKRDGRTYEMATNQLSISNIGLIFGLDPKSIWLKDNIGSRCYFPVGDIFEEMEEHTYTLFVEGTPPRIRKPQLPLSLTTDASTSSSKSPTVLGGSSGSSSKYGTCNVKVLRAEKIVDPLSGKVEFKTMEKGYVDMKSSTANITYLQSCIKKMWGEEYSVVSNDGLPIVDNQASRGIKFWKSPSRKLYAITNERKKIKRKRNCDDSGTEYAKKKIKVIKENISKVLSVVPRLPLPLGLSALFYSTFKCCRCGCSPIIPPVVFACCCKRIVGCHGCVERWFKKETTCPLCHGDRGMANMSKLKGLDDFLTSMKQLNGALPSVSE